MWLPVKVTIKIDKSANSVVAQIFAEHKQKKEEQMDPIQGVSQDVNPSLETTESTSAVVADGYDTIIQQYF